MMKIALNKSDEKGQALILVLILLLLASIIIAALLGFMGTGLKAGQVFEKKMHELYAAEAGVEDAIWRLQNGEIEVPEGEEVPLPDPPILNGNTVKTVEVSVVDKTVEEDEQRTYLITSTATSQDGSSTTIIQAYITNITVYLTDGSELHPGDEVGGNAYFTADSAELVSGVQITGDVDASGDLRLNADAVIEGIVCCGGNLKLNHDTVIGGEVHAGGDVALAEGATIGGDVWAGGAVTLNNNAQIMGDVHVLPAATVTVHGDGKITGEIYDDYWEWCPLDLDLGAEILSWEIR